MARLQDNFELPLDVHYYSGCKTTLQRPTVIGYFSVDGKRGYSYDGKLKYVCHTETKKKVNFNLNHMSDKTVKAIEENNTWERLGHVFHWIGLHGRLFFKKNDITFVTYRGNLTKIFQTPYENQEDWILCARIHDGVIYINNFETEKQRLRKSKISQHEQRCQGWGYKFEQYMLTDEPGQKPDIDQILNENEGFNCMFQTKLEHHRLIYGAEMDGVISENVLDIEKDESCLKTAYFVELKTTRIFEHEKQYKSFCRYKILKWWIQCYLVGIETVICGFRDDAGIVHTIEQYRVRDLVKMALGWNPHICLAFCVKFLDFVKRILLEDSKRKSNEVWKFECIPKQKVMATKISGLSNFTDGFVEINLTEDNLL